MKIILFIDYILYKINLYRHHIGFYLQQRKFLKSDKYVPKLSKNEKAMLHQIWPTLKFRSCDYILYRLYKQYFGFSPYFISEMQVWYLLEKLNPYDQVVSLQNKALCDVYFPQIPYPKVYVRGIAGRLYDKDMNIISLTQAYDIINKAQEIIIKPSIETLQGQGIKKILVDEQFSESRLSQIIADTGIDFIIQEVVKQHPDISKLNPTSLNTCRITSIYINQKFSISSCIKIGKKGSIKDNWNSSYFIGVDENGRLHDYGYDCNLTKISESDNGYKFGSITIPYMDKMLQFVEQTHKKYLPQCSIIGWDITIDNENNIKVIELNLTSPGLTAEQFASGEFLKPYCADINEALKQLPYHTYRKSISR